MSVPLEKCWEVPRKHCQSIPVKKPRIVVKKVPVKHCEYKHDHGGYGHDDHHGGGYGHDDHHGGGYGHDDHHVGGYGHDAHHGGGYGHHTRSDEEVKSRYSDPYSNTLREAFKKTIY